MLKNKIFFEKFHDISVQSIPEVDSISLSFFNKDKNIVLLGVSALYLITNIKPSILTKRLSKRRNARSEMVGSNVLLKKKSAIKFLNYLNLVVFPHFNDFTGIDCSITESGNRCIHFNVNNLLVFPELNRELDKFYVLKNLSITLYFKKDNYLIYNKLNNLPIAN
jgi:ribosomal protein L5